MKHISTIRGTGLPMVSLLAGLVSAAGCSFDSTQLDAKTSCRTDDDCLAGWSCRMPEGRCQLRQELPDAAKGTVSDAGRPDMDLAPHLPDGGLPPRDAGGEFVDDGAAPPVDGGLPSPDVDRAPPDSGSPPPDSGPPGCANGPCQPGEVCNRFDLCAPPDRECDTPLQCPAGETCNDHHFCAPPGRDCNDDPDCGSPEQICNPFGRCVPAAGSPAFCEPCASDAECGGPDGICLNSSYQDAASGAALVDEICSADCSDRPCPGGMRCQQVTRDGLLTGVCRWRTPSCATWREWGKPCKRDKDCRSPDSFCEDIHNWVGTEWACTYACDGDDECPEGSFCGSVIWHADNWWEPFCRRR